MSNILLTALFPHPPIMIPEVGKENTNKVAITIQSAKELAGKIFGLNPETIIIVTPHAHFDNYYNAYSDKILNGNLARFRAPEINLSYDNDIEFISELNTIIESPSEKLRALPSGYGLDHGSMVPLYYLHKAGFKGKIGVINYAHKPVEEQLKFGQLIAETANKLNSKTVLLLSGDLSHKLSPESPAGFDKDAKLFDEIIVNAIKDGNYDSILKIDPSLREKAGECAYNSILIGLGATGNKPVANYLYSYQSPFGVGYAVASL